MWNLSYTACSFVVREKYQNAKTADLNGNFTACVDPRRTYFGVIEVLKEYCKKHEKLKDKKEEKRLYRMDIVSQSSDEKMNCLLVEIESGRYGYKSNITDKETQKVEYQQKETDAPLMKFYLIILIPKVVENAKVYKGFMFFQNYGQYGVKTKTIRGMKKYFSEFFNSILWVGNISPEIFVETMLKAESIKKIYFVRNNISYDAADNVRFTYGKEQRVLEKMRLSEGFISKLRGYLSGSNRIFEFENKDYNDVKLCIDIGGRDRIIGLNNIENVSIIESLPDDLKKADGDINTQRLVSIVSTQAKEYMKRVICYIDDFETR